MNMLKQKIEKIRSENFLKHKKLSRFLTLLFPICMVFITEYNHIQDMNELISFAVNRPGVILFDIIIIGLCFCTILYITRSPWISALSVGVIFFTLSCVEFFKFQSSGTHFLISDLIMAADAFEVSLFADLQPTFLLFLNGFVVLLYPFVLFLLNEKIKIAKRKSIFTGIIYVFVASLVMSSPIVSNALFDVLKIDNEESANAFKANEKFENNNFIANLVQTTSEQFSRSVNEPYDYSKESVDLLLEKYNKTEEQSAIANVENNDFIKPNVVIIFSESFADFRQYKTPSVNLNIADDVYKGFDKVISEGYSGTAVVPCFGNYTVKTEFEIIFGIPLKSLGSPNIPQNILKNDEQLTFPLYYKNYGYHTAYIHPFRGDFYSRDEFYPTYGFDDLYFVDNMPTEIYNYRRFTDDGAVFDSIGSLINETKEPLFVVSMTMQNHMPYVSEDENSTQNSFDYYLDGIKHTSDRLLEFTEYLKTIDEPTIVLFVGDHFPFFDQNSDIYEKIGINAKNISTLYNQRYIVWSNQAYDYSAFSQDMSAFYLPHMLSKTINIPASPFMLFMNDKLKNTPIYTLGDSLFSNDKELDLISYDRILGEQFSDDRYIE